MIALVQRVSEASVTAAEPNYHESIGRGLCVLLAVERGDGSSQAEWIASKLVNLRVFPDAQGKMNLSVRDVGGSLLIVSQFTLAGDCSRGHRPSFASAADPTLGRELVDRVASLVRVTHQVPARTGVFGAHMQVRLANDGPVTLIIRRDPEPA
jgi:D-tyrosyl-tRNA(Tyr) deacylase